MILAIAVTLGIASVVMGAGMADVAISVFVLATASTTLIALRSASRVAPIGAAFIVSMSVALGISAWFTGGLSAEALTWLVAMPIVGHVVVGRRFAYGSAALSISLTLLAFGLEQARLLPRYDEPDVLVVSARSLLVVFLTAYSILQGDARERAIAKSEATTKALRVRESELSAALARADDEHAARVALEAELHQAQRLESLGRLAAGVSHEVNTPVQFVSDSLVFARTALGELFQLLEVHRAAFDSMRAGEPPSLELIASVESAEEEADVPYLAERLPKAIERSIDGLDRIAAIVRSMKAFSHAERSLMVPADLNRAIRESLVETSACHVGIAVVEADLEELPLVSCNLEEMNQVMVSLVSNAARAISTSHDDDGAKGIIRVRSRREASDVVISVSDDGVGIRDEIKPHVFDPFFTTREVGSGLGQGLAVAKNLVELHAGHISFVSAPGRGTTFTIRLPIERAPAKVESVRAAAAARAASVG